MKLIRKTQAQSTAEYAVLFAIVIGAAIAMQQFVKARLQGAIEKRATEYATEAESGVFEPDRTVTSDSESTLDMDTVDDGLVIPDSTSNTNITKEAGGGGGPGGPSGGPSGGPVF